MRVCRLPFLSVTILSAIVGAAFAFSQSRLFDWNAFFFGIVIVSAAHLGANIANDYFDHLSGNDEANSVFTVFNGGSRVIQKGELAPQSVLLAALLCFGIACTAGITFVQISGRWEWLWLGVLGVGLGFFYTTRPVAFAYRGFGELAVAIAFGPLVVGGAYLLQAGEWGSDIWFVALPLGLLTMNILLINEVPDRFADSAASKRTVVVRLGSHVSAWVYMTTLLLAYVIFLFGIFLRTLPLWCGLVFLSLPLAVWLGKSVFERVDRTEQNAFFTVSRGTVVLQELFAFLCLIGFFIG